MIDLNNNSINKSEILYIDDDALNLESFQALFEDDFIIHPVLKASDAFDLLEKNPIKIIISDQLMPEMTGIEFFALVQKKYPHIIRILLTGYTDFDIIKEAINEGRIYSFVNKPIEYQNFLILLNKAIDVYDLEARNRTLTDRITLKNLQLAESEERYRHISETINDYIYTLYVSNSKSYKLKHTPRLEELTGYSLEELYVAEPGFTKLIHPKDLIMLNESIEKILNGTSKINFEHRLIKKTGEIIWISNTLSLFKNNTQQGDFEYNGVMRNITERKEFQQKLFETVFETEENERKRFARDLHDELGPQLASLRLYSSSLKRRTSDKEQLEIIDKMMTQINQSIDNIRETSHNLSPHLLAHYGLATAIESEIESKNLENSIKFSHNIAKLRFENSVETAIYRIIKELLNNTLKYAEATEIEIKINFVEDGLNVYYTDNGKGFDYSALIKVAHKGMGLYNIASRVNSIKGQFKIDSRSNKGFDFELSVNTKRV